MNKYTVFFKLIVLYIKARGLEGLKVLKNLKMTPQRMCHKGVPTPRCITGK